MCPEPTELFCVYDHHRMSHHIHYPIRIDLALFKMFHQSLFLWNYDTSLILPFQPQWCHNSIQIIIQSDHLKFQIFSRFIGVDWSLIYEDRFHHLIY